MTRLKAIQYFSPEYLEQCRSMKPEQIVQFLEDFRTLQGELQANMQHPVPMETTFKNVSCIPATQRDQQTIQNMARFYVYEMSRYCSRKASEWEIPANGLYECADLSRYFLEPNRFPFLIRVQQECAGFVLVNKIGTSPDVDWNMGEFFILAKFQGKGIGTEVALQILNRFNGIWEIAQIPTNFPAIQFWQKVVKNYSSGNFTKLNQIIQEPTPHPMIVLKFNS